MNPSSPTQRALTVIGLGEALFDVYPDREILGGAPLNVAVNAHQLLAPRGGQGLPVSRIGRDALGARLEDELRTRGVSTAGLQVDPRRETGRVQVTLHGQEPEYFIVPDAAWDQIEFTDTLRKLAVDCGAVCFGTLGQRSPMSRAAIVEFVRHARSAIRLFDVNLRQDLFSAELIEQSCRLATIVKLNQHELKLVAHLLDLDGNNADEMSVDEQAQRLRERFTLEAVVLTRGAQGTAIYLADGKVETEPVSFPAHRQADSVGAGDACTAGILVGRLLNWPAEQVVSLANQLGAYVASQPGATPKLPKSLLQLCRT